MITAVYVIYYPDTALLSVSIASLIEQVDQVVVIDNSPEPSDLSSLVDSEITVVSMAENVGIAAAQNSGIEIGLAAGANYIILSDQDTVYPPDYMSSMLPVFCSSARIGAVVPRFVDANKTAVDGFVSDTPGRFKVIYPVDGIHEILQGIASGQIIRREALEDAGLMDADLFIDWVDLEWCWRARKAGYSILGNADVVIQHQLGDSSVDLRFREVNLRSPMRHYYITRNAFFLAVHSTSLEGSRRFNLFIRSFRYVFGFPVLAKPRLGNLKAVVLGMLHGLLGRRGKFDL